MKKLALVHTARVNDDLFRALVEAAGAHTPGEAIDDTHVLRADLLERATAKGVLTPEIQEETETLLTELADRCDAVLLTCSTLGPAADALNRPEVLRVDRALADAAVAGGGTIAVIVAAPSTVEPTRILFEEAAREGPPPGTPAGKAPIEMVMAEGAWGHFMAGDEGAYLEAVEDAARACVKSHAPDSIALAQASMASVAERLEGTLKGAPNIPVRSSPQAGLDAAFRFLAR